MHKNIVPGRHVSLLDLFPDFLKEFFPFVRAVAIPGGKIKVPPSFPDIIRHKKRGRSNPAVPGPDRFTGMAVITGSFEDDLYFCRCRDILYHRRIASFDGNELENDKLDQTQNKKESDNFSRRILLFLFRSENTSEIFNKLFRTDFPEVGIFRIGE